MAASFRDLYSELPGWVGRISPLLAQRLVNRGLHDIYDYRLWSFNVREGVLLAPAIVTAGTVSLTQYSNSITFDATAKAAINAISLTTPITKQQLRAGSGGGPVYSIIAWDSAGGVATLDRMFGESTNATATYQIYQCYYAAPESGFLRWVSMFDPINAYSVRLNYAKSDFDRWDPQRGAQGNPVYVGWFRFGQTGQLTVGLPMFELWPHPTAQIAYQCLYEVRGADLVEGDTIPYAIPDELVLLRARYRAYEWAMANRGSNRDLSINTGTNWLQLMQEVDKQYRAKIQDVARNDGETYLTSFGQKWNTRMFPNTGAYWAAHDVGEQF